MPFSITCSTKIHTLHTLAIVPFLFILVGVLCEFAMVPGVYILLSLQKKWYAILPQSTDVYTHLAAHSSNRFKPV